MNALRTGEASRIMPAIVVALALVSIAPIAVAGSPKSKGCHSACCNCPMPSEDCCNPTPNDRCPAMVTCKVMVWMLPVDSNRDSISRGAVSFFAIRMIPNAEPTLPDVPSANLPGNSLIQQHVRLQI